jgi:hypothetical protein
MTVPARSSHVRVRPVIRARPHCHLFCPTVSGGGAAAPGERVTVTVAKLTQAVLIEAEEP